LWRPLGERPGHSPLNPALSEELDAMQRDEQREIGLGDKNVSFISSVRKALLFQQFLPAKTFAPSVTKSCPCA
jgi:hypothetical protein